MVKFPHFRRHKLYAWSLVVCRFLYAWKEDHLDLIWLNWFIELSNCLDHSCSITHSHVPMLRPAWEQIQEKTNTFSQLDKKDFFNFYHRNVSKNPQALLTIRWYPCEWGTTPPASPPDEKPLCKPLEAPRAPIPLAYQPPCMCAWAGCNDPDRWLCWPISTNESKW